MQYIELLHLELWFVIWHNVRQGSGRDVSCLIAIPLGGCGLVGEGGFSCGVYAFSFVA
jgi:hypothetical protein